MGNKEVIYLIPWDNAAGTAYLYGSKMINARSRSTEFHNALMPAGKAIRSWYSKVNYQEKRFEPELPPLQEGENYCINAFYACDVLNGILICARFYDLRHKLIESAVTDQKKLDFVCPKDTRSWELHLQKGGANSIEYHFMELSKAEIAYSYSVLERGSIKGKMCNIVFLEPCGRSIFLPKAPSTLQRLDFVEVPVWRAENEYLYETYLTQLKQGQYNFIGYGPRSNAMALRCASQIASAHAYISGDGLGEMPPGLSDDKVTIYAKALDGSQGSRSSPAHLWIDGIKDYSRQLLLFPEIV